MSDHARPPEGPWGAARRRARAEVAAALDPRTRTCPRCGAAQDAGATRDCARCGAGLVERRPPLRLARRPMIALVAATLAVAAPIAVLVSQSRERAALELRAAMREQLELEATERRRLRREGRPRTAPLPDPKREGLASARRHAVRAGERLVTADARARVRAGRLDGPVIGTRCLPEPRTPTRRALEADPTAVRLVYDCVALKARFEAPPDEGKRRVGLFGHPYRAVVDHRRRSVTWCRVFPPAGEGGRSLAVASMDPACRARGPER